MIAYQAANEYIRGANDTIVKKHWKFDSKEAADEAHVKICQEEGIQLVNFVEQAEPQDLALLVVI